MQSFDLWQVDIPGKTHREIPRIHYYPTSEKKGRGTILIFAGGGYGARMAYEDADYAKFINQFGIDTFVVDYRITNRVKPGIFPDPVLDARRAVRFVRTNADKFGIDPDKIAVMGSSAGGHLSAAVSTYRMKLDGEGADALDEIDYLPNAQILCYPVTNIASERGTYVNLLGKEADSIADQYDPILLADEKTPPAFIWHTAEDEMVNVLGTYSYAKRLKELDVPVEMHVFPFGRHGLALGRGDDGEHHVAIWTELLHRWLILLGFLDK